MCGCGDKWYGPRPGLGFWVIILLILFLMGVGCSSAPVVPECPVQPKCPPSYVEQYEESERAADRLEDALRKSEDESRACVRVFEDSLRKSR